MRHPTCHRVPPAAVGPLVAVLVLLESGRRARALTVGRAEARLFRRFNGASDAIHLPVWALMQSGSLAAVFVVAGVLARAGRPRPAVVAAIAGTAVWGGVKLVKPFVGRGRPGHVLDDVTVRGQAQSGLGYPSGHAAVALTLALVLPSTAGLAGRVAALTFAGAVGGARMYVGAHLPLDVAGGLAIGALCGRGARSGLEAWS